jgi:hypothetical protein
MQVKEMVAPVLQQLCETLQLLSNDEYCKKCNLLQQSSIGNHTRHVIELFTCLINGYTNGIVNYENRKREKEIECNKKYAGQMLQQIIEKINLQNKILNLHTNIGEINNNSKIIVTNFYREIIYNIEHTIHHMALIRIGVNEVSSITLPINFGVAPATIQHKKLCAQ